MNEEKLDTFYEVYDKRAIYQGPDDLPLLDRDRSKEKAIASANKWGACVVQIICRLITWSPMNRQVVRWKVVHVHKAKVQELPVDSETVRTLKGKINSQGRFTSRFHKRPR